MKSYVDDMIAKSMMVPDHINYLKECFDNLIKYSMKLNPEKCVFRVSAEKFLRVMVSERGIEARLEKIKSNHRNINTPNTERHPKDGRLSGCSSQVHPRTCRELFTFI